MYSDKVLEPAQSSSVGAGAVSVRAGQGPAAERGGAESEKCRQACDAYDDAHANYLESASMVSATMGDRNAAAAAALAGLAILTFASSTFVWVMGFIVAMGCGGLALLCQQMLTEARAKCHAAIQKMYMEYRFVRKESGNADNLPARPYQTCP